MATQEVRRLTEQESKQLQFLSQTHRTLHSGRLKLEQTVVLTLLVFYAAFPGAVHQTGLNFSPCWLASLALPVVFAVFYLLGIKQANDFNQDTAQNAEDRIHNDLIESGLGVFPRTDQFNPNRNRYLWNFGIIVVFAIGSGLVSYEIITRKSTGLTESPKIEARVHEMQQDVQQIKSQVRELEHATAQHREKMERLEGALGRQRSTKSGRPK